MEWMAPDFEVPAVRRSQVVRSELRRQPGRWAVIDRYPPEKAGTARARGANLSRRHPDIEYAVRRDGDGYALYMRALPQDEEAAR